MVSASRFLRPAFLIAASLLISGLLREPIRSDERYPSPRSDRIANYRIDVRLDPQTKRIEGVERILWKNSSDDPIPDLRFHLYWNAFKNSETLFLKGSRRSGAEYGREDPQDWGWIEIDTLRLGSGEDLTDRISVEETVGAVPLPAPLLPGDSLSIEIAFHAKLPKLLARSGFIDDFFMLGQWFPKIAVHTEEGWHARPYHRNSEFFADFGNYDVTIAVPPEYIVGATGRLISEEDAGDGTRRHRFRAEDVHDFAWAASPRFRVVEETIDGLQIRILHQPHHEIGARRILDAIGFASAFFRGALGPYPYGTLTVVDPPAGAFGAMGVEYPTLINVGYFWWMPRGFRFAEETAIHEFGHQYWYGLVANNEVEDPWLDEGLTSYYTARAMEAIYGSGRSFLDQWGIRLGSIDALRRSLQRRPAMDPIRQPAHDYIDNRSYAVNAYSKSALLLLTLENRVGSRKWLESMRSFFQRFRYRHPTSSDFIAHLEANTPAEWHPFIEQATGGTSQLDYTVREMTIREKDAGAGYFRDPDSTEAASPAGPDDASPAYISEVIVERLGELHVPVDIHFIFEDGTIDIREWDGVKKWHRFTLEGPSRLSEVRIDPSGILLFDINPLNNRRTSAYQGQVVLTLTSRILFYLQNMAFILSSLI